MQKDRILSSLVYKFSERLLVKALGLVISIILARLLSPTEFGQIAIVMVFVNLSNVLIDSGLSAESLLTYLVVWRAHIHHYSKTAERNEV